MSFLIVVLLLFSSLGCADYIAPEALNNIAHIKFPEDRLAGQILRIQRDKFGLPRDLRCSSLLGPKCASQEALHVNTEMDVGEVPRPNRVFKLERLTLNSDASEENEDGVSLDAIIIAQLGLGPEVSEEDVEGARNVLEELDPSFLADVADKVAEVANIEDKEHFRHKFLSAFASLLVEEDVDSDPDADSEEDEEDEYVDDFFMHPSKVDQESNWEARREKARLDRITKRVKDTMADVLPVKRYTDEEEDDDDIHITHFYKD